MVATGDKDLAQIVSDKVTLLDTMKGARMGREGVFEKFGVWPERIIDFLALMGDKVDNVPGIDKCGPKTAAKWIAQYGSLEGVVEHAGEVKGKAGEYLRAGLPFIPTAKTLVTVRCDLELGVDLEALTVGEPDREGCEAFFRRWEMRSGLRRLSAQAARPASGAAAAQQGDLFSAGAVPAEAEGARAASEPRACRTVRTAADLSELAGRLEAERGCAVPVAVALAVDGEGPMRLRAAALAFAVSPFEAWHVPLAGAGAAAIGDVKAQLGPWLSGGAPKLFEDAKRARHALANAGLALGGVLHDASLMSYVLEAHLKHDLESIAARKAGVIIQGEEQIAGKGAKRQPFAEADPAALAAWLGARAAALRTSGAVLLAAVAASDSFAALYGGVERPVSEILWRMERTGVLIDTAMLAAQTAELDERVREIAAGIEAAAGEPFNPASPKQLGQILFEKLGLPVKHKTSSGAPSTDEEALAELALDYPLPKMILEWRRLTKLKGTYTEKLPQMVD
ncbi:MAG: DNA polymerase I, partial [Duodenibacillus sp.]|nr:DNA polymerase I [Duodenibacillus sp.]